MTKKTAREENGEKRRLKEKSKVVVVVLCNKNSGCEEKKRNLMTKWSKTILDVKKMARKIEEKTFEKVAKRKWKEKT